MLIDVDSILKYILSIQPKPFANHPDIILIHMNAIRLEYQDTKANINLLFKEAEENVRASN